MTLHPALFLDRDGVIIEDRANYVRSWSDVEIFPQAVKALAQIHNSPYKIIIVTNQSCIGRGIVSLKTINSINQRLVQEIERAKGRIDAVFMCPRTPQENCDCRKPAPGLLLQATQQLSLDLSQSTMIGDALTDIGAGRAAGVGRTALLRTGRGTLQSQLPEATEYQPLQLFDTLASALPVLLSRSTDKQKKSPT